MRVVVLFLLLLNVSFGYKFLVYSPLFFHSMCKWIGMIANTLTEAGHDVTVLLPVVDPSLLEKTGVKGATKKIFVPGDENYAKFIADNVGGLFQDAWSEEQGGALELIEWGKKFKPLLSETCDMILSNKTLLADLKNENFDVAIAEPFYICGFGLFEHLNISKVIAASSTTLFEKVSYVLGEPVTPSYVPSMEWAGGVPKTMMDRTMNALGSIGSMSMLDYIYQGESEVLRKHFGDSFGGAEEVLARSSVHFTQSNPYLDFPKAKIHKTVELGGITANIEKSAVLDEKFDKILSLRPQTVLISFGTVCLSKDMPNKYKETIVEVMQSFPEVTFIWKYEEDTDIAKHLPNVHMVKWQPQPALLADPRLSLFITHGGLGSTLELAHSGKPAITIPVIADQPRNSAMLARHGGTINLPKEDLNSPDKLKEALQKMLKDKSYTAAAEKLERMLKEQPVSAKNLLLLHAEYVAKFGPLTMLDPYGRQLSIFEYYLIDVIAVLLGAFMDALPSMLVFFLLFLSVTAEHFWTTTQITDFEMKEGCLHTRTTCTHPRIQIKAKMLTVNAVHETSWNLNELIVGRFLATDWTDGYTDGVLVSTQILGIDSTYGIERVCDSTIATRPFPATPVYIDQEERVDGTTAERSIDFGTKCFNVTLTVKMYTGRCPWCPEPEPEQVNNEQISKTSNSSIALVLIYVLLFIIVICSIGSVVMFIKLYRQPKGDTSPVSSVISSPETVRTFIVSEISRSRTSSASRPPSIDLPTPPVDAQLDNYYSPYDGDYESISSQSGTLVIRK